MAELLLLAKPFRKRRNRAIARNVLPANAKLMAKLSPGVSVAMIKVFLGNNRDCMNADETTYRNCMTVSDMVITPNGSDGNFLSDQLKRAEA